MNGTGLCYFCMSLLTKEKYGEVVRCLCPACGDYLLTREAAEDIHNEEFELLEKIFISISLRNEHEKRYRKPSSEPLNLDDLHRIAKQYSPLTALEKMDNALTIIEKKTFYVGTRIDIDIENDCFYFHCYNAAELIGLLLLLQEEDYISAHFHTEPQKGTKITAKGYKRLQELRKQGKDSRQCFVAMWLASEMDEVYEKAIKEAIEYKEEGQNEPRFRALRIDNVEHINDINDEIIAAIRRSRFMICDLTGYRGGVYFEAGFAYGLGLDVIYTCRKDWTKGEILRDKDRNEVKFLYDSAGREIEIKKEGVHFDIRNMSMTLRHSLFAFSVVSPRSLVSVSAY